MIIVPPTPDGIGRAAAAIRAGEVVAYPTETVYGLAVNPFSAEAVQRLFEFKGRDPTNPILLIVADEEQLTPLVSEIGAAARACIAAFWPGPLSLLLPKSARIPEALTAGREKVCVRLTCCAVARDLCLAAGSAITSTSANRSGCPAARSLGELDLPGIAVAIDGGVLPPGPPSTVFDPQTGELAREGAVPMDALFAVLGS